MKKENKETVVAVNSNDYIELLLRHLVRSPRVFKKAKSFAVEGADFILDEEYGMVVYKAIVDAINEIGASPIDMALLSMHMSTRFDSHELSDQLYDNCVELVNFMYDGELNEDYFLDSLKDFIRVRRGNKAVFLHKNDIPELSNRLGEIGMILDVADCTDQGDSLHPFLAPVFADVRDSILTGFNRLDQVTNGLSRGEYGQIIGFSGGGKSALGVNIVYKAAQAGLNATYVSLELTAKEVAWRCYANQFDISYTKLHSGRANMDLTQAWGLPQFKDNIEQLNNYVYVDSLKAMAPVTVEQIHARMVQKYETDGFVPDVIMLDQLSFIKPKVERKSEQEYQIQGRVSMEVDELSHQSIGGKNFALWAQHQAKGKLRKQFSREDILGFKAIINPADLTIGVGRDTEMSHDFNFFSLKTRHCPAFSLEYTGDLEYMRFSDAVQEGTLARDNQITNATPRSEGRKKRETVGVEP